MFLINNNTHINLKITVGHIPSNGAGRVLVELIILTNTKCGPIHPDHTLLVSQGGVPAAHQPGARGGAGESHGRTCEYFYLTLFSIRCVCTLVRSGKCGPRFLLNSRSGAF